MKQKQTTVTNFRALPGLTLSSSMRKWGTNLFNQQMWCWGTDVRREAGNLLLAYGFHRQRPPANKKGASMYSLELATGAQIKLWGFGMFYSKDEENGLFLKRLEFIPRLLSKTMIANRAIWNQEQLPPLRKPRTGDEIEKTIDLLSQSLTWIGTYETWVWQTDANHRRHAVANWDKATITADNMRTTWLSLSQECMNLLIYGDENHQKNKQ